MKKLRQKRNSRNLYRCVAICTAFVLVFALGIPSQAARTGNVKVESVNVRAEATTDSARVCQLPENTTVNVVEEKTAGDGKVWYHVSFTLEGADKTGWIRSDMLSVTEEEEEGNEGEISIGGSGSYVIQEPIESYDASDALIQTTIAVGDEDVTAWQVDTNLTGGEELYLVSAKTADGSVDWFYYDPAEETFQRDLGQFAESGESEPEGLIQALQSELTGLKESTAKQLSMRLYIIIALAVVCVFLLVVAIVFGLKYRDAAYEYYEDEDEDEDFDEDEDEDEDEDDFDDFFAQAKKKAPIHVEEVPEAEPVKEEPAEEIFEEVPEETALEAEPVKDEASEEELMEIDLSIVEETIEAAQKERQEAPAEEEDSFDFDIQILDWEDLGL